jgi:plastocyanin
MKLRILPFLAAALLVGLPMAAPAQTTPTPTPNLVHIKNFMFVPATITVAPGTAVTFVNDDDEPHTVTANDKSFDSEGLDTHQKYTHTFAKAGTFMFFCEVHPYMHGTVIVKAAS